MPGIPDALALFGGQFDPFHWGHAHVIQQLLPRFRHIVVLPSAHPPHRAASETPFHHRFAMVQHATAQWSAVTVSDYDTQHTPSFALHTVRHFHAQYPGIPITLVIGSDQYAVLHTWHHIDTLCDLAQFFVVPRDTQPRTNPQLPASAHVTLCTAPPYPLSATELRADWRATLVPPAVADYCQAHGLYA